MGSSRALSMKLSVLKSDHLRSSAIKRRHWRFFCTIAWQSHCCVLNSLSMVNVLLGVSRSQIGKEHVQEQGTICLVAHLLNFLGTDLQVSLEKAKPDHTYYRKLGKSLNL